MGKIIIEGSSVDELLEMVLALVGGTAKAAQTYGAPAMDTKQETEKTEAKPMIVKTEKEESVAEVEPKPKPKPKPEPEPEKEPSTEVVTLPDLQKLFTQIIKTAPEKKKEAAQIIKDNGAQKLSALEESTYHNVKEALVALIGGRHG